MVSSPDVLGLAGLLPGPGWVILDAARDQRFTGELVALADEEVRVYFDRGRIYVAERASDPPLGTRLVDAGALNRAQLEYGTLKIGTIEHLGRLFDRVPSVNRDGVLVINELMTEQCVRWLAGQPLQSVTATPYRHHESGMHRWEIIESAGAPTAGGTPPEMALPAPAPDAQPLIAAGPAEPEATPGPVPRDEPSAAPAPPESSRPSARLTPSGPSDRPDRPDRPSASGQRAVPRRDLFEQPVDPLLDDVVEWDEPSSLSTGWRRATTPERTPRDPLADPTGDGWVDALDHSGVADAGTGSAREHLEPLAVRRPGEFGLIWPSGETDDLADQTSVSAPPDEDRVGPTARVVSEPTDLEPLPVRGDRNRRVPADARPPVVSDLPAPAADAEPSAEAHTTLAVRRAVATIDTGSLDARRRLVDASTATTPPGRLVVERDHHLWRTNRERATTSVFDEQPVAEPEPMPAPPETSDEHDQRSGALRRLITSLRRT